MANLYANRAEFIIGGADVKSFFVNQRDILSIFVKFSSTVIPINALNYTPSNIATITTNKNIDVIFEFSFSDDQDMFDFFALPYDLTNVQLLLFSNSNKPWLICSSLYFKGDTISFPDQRTAAKRSIIFGALDIQHFGGLG